MALFLGIDIGGTKIAGGLVTEDGEVARRAAVPTPAREGGPRVLASALAMVGTHESEFVIVPLSSSAAATPDGCCDRPLHANVQPLRERIGGRTKMVGNPITISSIKGLNGIAATVHAWSGDRCSALCLKARHVLPVMLFLTSCLPTIGSESEHLRSASHT